MPSTAQHTSFRAGSRTLSGYLFHPQPADGRRPGLLFVHGLRSDQSGYRDRAELASARLRVSCFTFDLSGHGESRGSLEELSPRAHLADVLAAYDVLSAEGEVDSERIGVCAASYGAYLAALLISDRPAKRLLLRAPALYADEDLDAPIGTRRGTRGTEEGSAALASLSRYGGDVLIVESGRDEVIPPETIDAYRSACERGSYVSIPDATHALDEPAWRRTFMDFILSWFAKL